MESIGGTEDHVHLVMALPPKLSLAHAIGVIKANSSRWMSETGHLFAWQDGYGAFSVSASNLDAVVKYVEHQAEHHAGRDFAAEFRALLHKHGIECDPAYGDRQCRPKRGSHSLSANFPGLTPWAKCCFALRAGAVADRLWSRVEALTGTPA